jgi:hypothetical protein
VSTTDELLRNAEGYAASFDKGNLPLPRSPASTRARSSRTRGRCAASSTSRDGAPARGDVTHQAH